VGVNKSTRSGRPWKVVHREKFETLPQARLREAAIKSWKTPTCMRDLLRIPEPQ
tara:strand:+ start:235 stop:396 length:162 start_codon:yes stop_codon:yes gene_type:complete